MPAPAITAEPKDLGFDADRLARITSHFKAYVDSTPVTITKGQLSITFTPQVENPQINAIEKRRDILLPLGSRVFRAALEKL